MIFCRVEGLERSIDIGQESITITQGLIQGGIDLLTKLVDGLDVLRDDALTLLEAVNGLCPKQRTEICTDLTDAATCETDGIFDGLVMQSVINYFDNNRTIATSIEWARGDLEGMLVVADSINEKADTFNWAFWMAVAFTLSLSVMCIYMMFGLVLKFEKPMKCLHSCVVFPTFVFLVILSFVFAMTFIIASMGLADTCVDDPDTRLLSIADHFLADSSPIVTEFVNLYLTSKYFYLHIPGYAAKPLHFKSVCLTYVPVIDCDEKPVEIAEILQVLREEGTDLLGRFSDELVGFDEKREAVCGVTDATLLAATAVKADAYLCTLAGLLIDIRGFFRCGTWYPLYQNTVHDAMCYSATDGFAWIASSQFVVVFMAMIVLTCRVVFNDIEMSKVAVGQNLEEEGANEGIEVEAEDAQFDYHKTDDDNEGDKVESESENKPIDENPNENVSDPKTDS
jgi:hypothetical protein